MKINGVDRVNMAFSAKTQISRITTELRERTNRKGVLGK